MSLYVYSLKIIFKNGWKRKPDSQLASLSLLNVGKAGETIFILSFSETLVKIVLVTKHNGMWKKPWETGERGAAKVTVK